MREESENPGALAGATEVDLQSWWDWFDGNVKRQEKATALIRALVDCAPEDRLMFLEELHEALRPGWPIVTFGSIMSQAQFWADMACRDELKAYCAVCFLRLRPDDRAAFITFAQGKVAA